MKQHGQSVLAAFGQFGPAEAAPSSPPEVNGLSHGGTELSQEQAALTSAGGWHSKNKTRT